MPTNAGGGFRTWAGFIPFGSLGLSARTSFRPVLPLIASSFRIATTFGQAIANRGKESQSKAARNPPGFKQLQD
jgi:hypothetical protein